MIFIRQMASMSLKNFEKNHKPQVLNVQLKDVLEPLWLPLKIDSASMIHSFIDRSFVWSLSFNNRVCYKQFLCLFVWRRQIEPWWVDENNFHFGYTLHFSTGHCIRKVIWLKNWKMSVWLFLPIRKNQHWSLYVSKFAHVFLFQFDYFLVGSTTSVNISRSTTKDRSKNFTIETLINIIDSPLFFSIIND